MITAYFPLSTNISKVQTSTYLTNVTYVHICFMITAHCPIWELKEKNARLAWVNCCRCSIPTLKTLGVKTNCVSRKAFHRVRTACFLSSFVLPLHTGIATHHFWRVYLRYWRLHAVSQAAYQGWKEPSHNHAAHTNTLLQPWCSCWCQCVATHSPSQGGLNKGKVLTFRWWHRQGSAWGRSWRCSAPSAAERPVWCSSGSPLCLHASQQFHVNTSLKAVCQWMHKGQCSSSCAAKYLPCCKPS